MLYKLISAEGDQAFDLRPGSTLIVGRALNCDIPVFDATISRRHAEVAADPQGVQVTDLGSSNGTFLNGTRVEQCRVASGDVITFGKVAFRLREVAPPPEPVTPTPPTGPAPKPGSTIIGKLAVGSLGTGGLVDVLRSSGPQAVTGAPEDRTQMKLAALLKVATDLTKQVDVNVLLDLVVEKCFDLFQGDRASILLGDTAQTLQPRVARDKKARALGELVPQSIARAAFENKDALLSENASEDARFGGQSILMQQVRSAMCAPLVGSENRALGVIYVDSQMTNHRFTRDDLEFLAAFSSIAGVAIENSQFAERIRKESLARSNFERFFTPGLAARIAESPDAVKLGGEKKPVAVLFSDIRGFTALSESMNPDAMASLLTEYFTEMVECVFRHGGTLDKFIGDAVMAQWGAPIGAPDDPDRAIQAAIEMMDALDELNRKWESEGKPVLAIGIGLNHGEAFAGNIGSERRLEFTVIGDTVNIASRLCSAAAGGEILISDEMRRALTAPPPLDEQPAMELKGKSQPVPIYRVRR